MTSTVKRWPAETDETFPEIFTQIPPQPKEKKPGQLSEDQIKQYFEKGYVLLEDYVPKEMLDACREGVNDLVEFMAQELYEAGKINDLYKGYGLFERLTKIDKEFRGANMILHKSGTLPQSFRNLWSWDHLLNTMEQLLGTSDISGHPVWNLRSKTPQNEATTVPWHQDIAYLDNDSYKVLQVTAWIPLLDATEANGCMQVIPGAHSAGRVIRHTCCSGDTHYVMLDEKDLKDKLGYDTDKDYVTVPVPYGGVLLFNNLLPHRSLNNLSDQIRWSLDLRWQRADKPVGFHGLLDGVQMRSSTDPDLKIKWDEFVNQGRPHQDNTPEKKSVFGEFETVLPGPWMKRWEITHENRHTRSWLELEKGKGGVLWH